MSHQETPLSTGSMTPEQLVLSFSALPFDVTFVDEHDRVRYFSQGYRIFSRTPDIIGTDVVECHSPASKGAVAQLISELKSGRRDEAEFLEEVNDRLVHIHYIALRDDGGTYKGVLEIGYHRG